MRVQQLERLQHSLAENCPVDLENIFLAMN